MFPERKMRNMQGTTANRTPDSSFDIYYSATLQLFRIYLLGVVLFMCFRTALLAGHAALF